MPLFKNADLQSRRRYIILVALICLAILAYIDWFTGPSVSVICFYLIPIFLLSWFGGWRLGLIVAGLHAATWLAIDFEWLPRTFRRHFLECRRPIHHVRRRRLARAALQQSNRRGGAFSHRKKRFPHA